MAGKDDERAAMLRALTRGLYRDGLRAIQAVAEGYPRPDLINGVRPDATGRDNLFHIFAVVLPEEIPGEDPERRWPPLAEYSARTGAKFYVVVPSGNEERVRKRLRELDLNAFIVEV